SPVAAPSHSVSDSTQGTEVTGRAEGPARFRLPRAISTEIELENVDLSTVMARGEAVGIYLPIDVAGRLSISAHARIPIGALRDLRRYELRGSVTLTGASIAGVDFGRAGAVVNLHNGILELSEIQGELLDMPDGAPGHLPRVTEPIPGDGPLPP